jgi:hypothetical protein
MNYPNFNTVSVDHLCHGAIQFLLFGHFNGVFREQVTDRATPTGNADSPLLRGFQNFQASYPKIAQDLN